MQTYKNTSKYFGIIAKVVIGWLSMLYNNSVMLILSLMMKHVVNHNCNLQMASLQIHKFYNELTSENESAQLAVHTTVNCYTQSKVYPYHHNNQYVSMVQLSFNVNIFIICKISLIVDTISAFIISTSHEIQVRIRLSCSL